MDTRERLNQAIAIADKKTETAAQRYARTTQLRALFTLIPYVGGSIDAALTSVAQKASERQIELWTEEVNEQLDRLARQFEYVSARVRSAEFLQSQPGQALLTQAVQAAETWRATVAFPGATPVDVAVLGACCAVVVAENSDYVIRERVQTRPEVAGIPEWDFSAALQKLDEHGLLDAQNTSFGDGIIHQYRMPMHTLHQYCSHVDQDYPPLVRAIAQALHDLAPVTTGLAKIPSEVRASALASQFGDRRMRVCSALTWLKSQGYISVFNGPDLRVMGTFPTLRRFLQAVNTELTQHDYDILNICCEEAIRHDYGLFRAPFTSDVVEARAAEQGIGIADVENALVKLSHHQYLNKDGHFKNSPANIHLQLRAFKWYTAIKHLDLTSIKADVAQAVSGKHITSDEEVKQAVPHDRWLIVGAASVLEEEGLLTLEPGQGNVRFRVKDMLRVAYGN